MATRGRIRYKTKIENRFNISNDIEELKEVDSKTNILTGFDIDTSSFAGDEGYFVKQSGSGAKAVLIRVQNLNTEKPTVRGFKPLNYSTYGMAYYADYVYITSKGSTVVKSSAKSRNDTPKVYEVKDTDGALSGCQAITHYTGNKFIVMANAKKENSNLCFWVGAFNDSELTFDVSEKFYVKNTTGNQYIRDIYYHPSYGLFIATNKRGGTASNMIMRVEIDREADSTYNREALYNPDAEYKFDGIASRYLEFNVMGLSIGRDGILYTAVKVTKGEGKYTDAGVFLINNMKFASSGTIEIDVECSSGIRMNEAYFIDDNGEKRIFHNPGGFAMPGMEDTQNGMKGYCLKTYTSKAVSELTNKASTLLSTENVSTKPLSMIGCDVLTEMGHGNGMTYHKGSLYVAAYDRSNTRMEIAKISLEGIPMMTYQCENVIGGIAHYKNENEFIVVDYTRTDYPNYASTPLFYIGTLDDNTQNFVKNEEFSVLNPTYASGDVLQDIHYTPYHGLFFCAKTGKIDRIYRVTPEQIDNREPNKLIVPKEVYVFNNAIVGEVESFSLGSDGRMYFSENKTDPDTNEGIDSVKCVQTLEFYSE